MKLQCTKCMDIIEGDKKGTYITCNCGKIAIDETPYYYRIIGNREDFNVLDNKEVEKVEKEESTAPDNNMTIYDYTD